MLLGTDLEASLPSPTTKQFCGPNFPCPRDSVARCRKNLARAKIQIHGGEGPSNTTPTLTPPHSTAPYIPGPYRDRSKFTAGMLYPHGGWHSAIAQLSHQLQSPRRFHLQISTQRFLHINFKRNSVCLFVIFTLPPPQEKNDVSRKTVYKWE